jgi:hypothetical protein
MARSDQSIDDATRSASAAASRAAPPAGLTAVAQRSAARGGSAAAMARGCGAGTASFGSVPAAWAPAYASITWGASAAASAMN